MSAFITQINVADIDVAIPTDEEIADGATMAATTLQVGLVVPIGPNSAAMIAAGQIGFGLNREQLEDIGNKYLEAAEKLPKSSKLAVASSMQEAQATAQALQLPR